jgi:hypothetical protein
VQSALRGKPAPSRRPQGNGDRVLRYKQHRLA